MEAAVAAPIMSNEPFAVSPDSLIAAVSGVNELGLEITDSEGDAAFRALH